MLNSSWLQHLKFKNLLLFLFLCHDKFNIYSFWSVGQTTQAIW